MEIHGVIAAAFFVWICAAAPPKDILPNVVYSNVVNTTQGSTFQNNLRRVYGYLFDETQRNGSANYGYGSYPDTVYGFSECYNMSRGDCGQCFNSATREINQTAPLAVGAQIYINSSFYRCFLRYENYNFNGISTAPPPSNDAPPPSNDAPPLTNASIPQGGKNSSTNIAIIAGSVVAVVIVVFCACFGYFLCYRPRKRRGLEDSNETRHIYARDSDNVFEGSLDGPRVYSYEELRAATEDFIPKNKLGQGGFGTVHKGTLNDGTQVAIKKLSLNSSQGKQEFVNEVTIISSIQQRNLVRLKGYCIEDDHRLLVLEFLQNGSLDDALFGGKIALDWPTRHEIAVGVARGLAYLHEESGTQIIHRDIKASNILLDDKLKPKISDFGISKLFDREKGFTSTRIAGTFGYLAPEYALRGRLTAKADVFSFGVVLMEIVSGRKCSAPSLPAEQELLIEWAWFLHEKGELETLIDTHLEMNNHSKDEALRTLYIALLCTQQNPEARPIMSKVAAMLLEYLELPQISMDATPAYFTTPPLNSTTTTTSGTSNSKSSAATPSTEIDPR